MKEIDKGPIEKAIKDYGPIHPPKVVVQAHLGKPTKFIKANKNAPSHTRDWSVYFFFRILNRAEFEAFKGRFKTYIDALSTKDGLEPVHFQRLVLDMGHPGVFDPGVTDQVRSKNLEDELEKLRAEEKDSKIINESEEWFENLPTQMDMGPAQHFLSWLKLIAGADSKDVENTILAIFKDVVQTKGTTSISAYSRQGCGAKSALPDHALRPSKRCGVVTRRSNRLVL